MYGKLRLRASERTVAIRLCIYLFIFICSKLFYVCNVFLSPKENIFLDFIKLSDSCKIGHCSSDWMKRRNNVTFVMIIF